MLFRSEMTEPMRRGIVILFAQAFVGDNLVVEGEFMAQIIKNKE